MRTKLIMILLLSLIWFEFANGRIYGKDPAMMAEATKNFQEKNDEMIGNNVMKTDSKEELKTIKNDELAYAKNDNKDGEENNIEANENDAQNIGIQKDNDEKRIAAQWKNTETETVENLKEIDKLSGKNEEMGNQNQKKELELDNKKFYNANVPSEAVKNLLENVSIVENSDDISGYLRIFPFLKPCSPDSIANFRALLRDPKLTKGELEDRREKWTEKQPEDVKKAFMEWKTRLNDSKQKVVKRIDKNLASYIEGIKNLYQNLKEIIANMQISRHEECQQIRSLVNSANFDVREYFSKKVRIRLVQYCLTQKGNASVNEVSIEGANTNANAIEKKNQQTDQISQISKAQGNEQKQPATQESSNRPTSITPASSQLKFVNNGEEVNVQPNLLMKNLPKEQQEPSDKNTPDEHASNGSSVSSEEEDGNVVDESKTAVNVTAPIWPNSAGVETSTWKPDPVPDPPKNVNNSSSSSSSEENLEKEVKEELEKEDKLDKAKAEADKKNTIKDVEKKGKDINESNKNAGDMDESSSSSSSSSSESSSSSSSSSSSNEDDKDNVVKENRNGKKGVKKKGKEDKATEVNESSSSSSSSSEENERKNVRVKKNKKRGGKKKRYGKKREQGDSSASSSLVKDEGNKKKKKNLVVKDEEENADEEDDDKKRKRTKHGKRKHNRHSRYGKEENSEVEDKKKKHKKHQKEE